MNLNHPLGKYAGYNPSFYAIATAKKIKCLPGQSRMAQAHRYFRHGLNTIEIAERMLITEAEAEKLLDAARNKLIEINQAA
ncbi:hypothetical protein ACLBWS_05800 [Brucellaceae bacterium D45D]